MGRERNQETETVGGPKQSGFKGLGPGPGPGNLQVLIV